MKVRPLYLIIILLVILFAFMRIYPKYSASAEKTAFIMGTPVRVKVKGPNANKLANLALSEIKRLEKDLLVESSVDYQACLAIAEKVKKQSKGAFDVRFAGKVNLRGIGKGYAAEYVRNLLKKKGARNGIIDMRSTIAVFGPRSWKVGVRHPREKDKLIATVELRDGQSLATSGDYERGSHIIDPRTGKPAQACQSVTVIGTNAAETDAWSTAIFVLGKQVPGIKSIIVDTEGKIHDNTGAKLR